MRLFDGVLTLLGVVICTVVEGGGGGGGLGGGEGGGSGRGRAGFAARDAAAAAGAMGPWLGELDLGAAGEHGETAEFRTLRDTEEGPDVAEPHGGANSHKSSWIRSRVSQPQTQVVPDLMWAGEKKWRDTTNFLKAVMLC